MTKNALLLLASILSVAFAFAVPSRAQAVLPMGTVEHVSEPHACTAGQGWDTHMSCVDAALTDCPGIQDMPFTYGYEKDPQAGNAGTIVLLSGWGGTAPTSGTADLQFAEDYYNRGYEVVMLAWKWDWELTSNPIPHGTFGNIQAAACRPATFLNYVYNNPDLYASGPDTGICAQGNSAGSAAVAYALTWYGAGDYLDNVELLNGPVFSRIDQGCEVPVAPDVSMCPEGQPGCVGWPLPTLQLTPEYIDGYEGGPRKWTGIPACAGNASTAPYNSVWNAMSIVSDSSTREQFSYPRTSMAGWVCATTKAGVAMNNSGSQGELYYQQINDIRQNYSVNAIYNCPAAEGVSAGGAVTETGQSGFSAIESDSFANCRRKPRR